MLKDAPVKAMIDETYGILSKSLNESITQKIPPALTAAFKENVYNFSGFKTAVEMKQASSLLMDSNGGIKPFHQFEKEVLKLNEQYNKTYLRTEYNFAVASAQMAAKWEEILEDGDEYDVQFRTAGDSLVRPDHAALNGITLPPSDPFWSKYLPPLDWGCRCTVEQVRINKYPRSEHEDAMEAGEVATSSAKDKIFRFNPHEEEELFPPKHPYYKAGGKEVEKVIQELADEEAVMKEFKEEDKKRTEVKTNEEWSANRDELAKRYGLTEAEKVIITSYTAGSRLLDINDPIYKGEKLFELEESCLRTLNRALEKLPNYNGIVYRGVKDGVINKDRLNEYEQAFKNGGTIVEKAFISTSRDRFVTSSFGEGVSYRIKSKTGKDLEPFSYYSHEKEILLGSSKTFKVVGLRGLQKRLLKSR